LNTTEVGIRDDIVVKVALIAEKFAPSTSWFVDIMLLLVSSAEDVGDSIFNMTIRTILNCEQVQVFAAKATYKHLKEVTWNDCYTRLAAYILGEYAAIAGIKISEVFDLLKEKYPISSQQTKCFIATAFAKFRVSCPSLSDEIDAFFDDYSDSQNILISERITEYQFVFSQTNLADKAFEPIPGFSSEAQQQFLEQETEVVHKSKEKTEDDIFLEKQTSTIDSIMSLFDSPAPQTQTKKNSSIDDLLSINITPQQTNYTPQTQQTPASDSFNDTLSIFSSINVTPTNNTPKEETNPITTVDSVTEEQTPTQNKIDDFTSEYVFDSNSFTSPPPIADEYPGCLTESIPDELAEQIKKMHNKLMLDVGGLIYQDDIIQIGMKSQISSPTVTVGLFFGNRTSTPVNINVSIKCPNGLTMEAEPFVGTINPSSQIHTVLPFKISNPYNEAPSLILEYSSRNISMSLPLAFNAFMVAKPLDPQLFMKNYNNIFDSEIAEVTARGDIRQILKCMNLAILDFRPTQIVACSTYPGTQDIFCYIRIEVNGQNMKMTVRSENKSFAKVVKNLLKFSLSQ